VITSLSGKGTGHDRDHVEAKEPGLARIIRLNRGVMDLGAKNQEPSAVQGFEYIKKGGIFKIIKNE